MSSLKDSFKTFCQSVCCRLAAVLVISHVTRSCYSLSWSFCLAALFVFVLMDWMFAALCILTDVCLTSHPTLEYFGIQRRQLLTQWLQSVHVLGTPNSFLPSVFFLIIRRLVYLRLHLSDFFFFFKYTNTENLWTLKRFLLFYYRYDCVGNKIMTHCRCRNDLW